MNHAIMRHCVFIDECGYNIWTARNHGRARQGERAYRHLCDQRGRNVTVALAVSPVNGLMFHSAYIGGINAPRFNDFLAQTRQNLDPDEEVVFIYDGAPAHRNPAIPAANTELEMLPPYIPFLNIVEQAISSLKAAIKGDVSRPEIQARMDGREEARRLGIPLGEMRTRLLLNALQRCIGVITTSGLGSCKPICPAVLMGRKLKANNVLCIYLQSSLHLFTNSCSLCNVFICKKISAKRM